MKSNTKRILSVLFCLTLITGLFGSYVAQADARIKIHRFSDGFSNEYSYEKLIGAVYNNKTYIMGGTYIGADNKILGREAIEVTTNDRGEVDLPEYDEKILTMTAGDRISFGDGSTVNPNYFQATDGYLCIDDAVENMPTDVTCKLTVAQSLSDATYFTTSWYDRWHSPKQWKNDIINDTNKEYDNRIVLVTDGDVPYFAAAWYNDATHLSVTLYSEVCTHRNMYYVPGIPATCSTNGTCGCYCCPECPGVSYADENGNGYISALTLQAYGAIDTDDDGVCDDCGKHMPIYQRVTAPSEISESDVNSFATLPEDSYASKIMPGSKYLLVTQMGDAYYVMKNLSAADAGYLGTDKIDAAPVLLDGEKIRFMDAKQSDAMMANLKFSTLATNWTSGGARYGMHYIDNGLGYVLTCYGGNLLPENSEIGKYGNNITLNADGTVRVASAYDEYWYGESSSTENPKKGESTQGDATTQIYFRAFSVTQDGETTRFFSMLPGANYEAEGVTVTEYPIYLYRLVENGTVESENGTISYLLSDEETNADYTYTAQAEITENVAIAATSVSGIAQAMTQQSIESYISQITPTGDVRLNTKVNVSVVDYVSPIDGQLNGIIAFDLEPVIYDSAVPGNAIAISDYSFNGTPMTVTLYTGGIEPAQIIHDKQDGTKEYFYREYSAEAENGEKTFSFDRDQNGNTYAEFTVTEFSGVRLLETPEVNECAILSFDEKSAAASVSCAEAGTYSVVFADYEEGALNDVKIATISLTAGVNTVSVPEGISISFGDKIFLWESLNSLKPLCQAYIVGMKK